MNFSQYAVLALCFFAQGSGIAWAQSPPSVDVATEGPVFIIRAEAVLSAKPAQIWATLTDCAKAPSFVPNLESCKVIEKDPAGRWDIRENIANPPFLPRVKTIVRNEYAPLRGFTYRLVSGDLRLSEGSWTINPIATGTRVTYAARFEPKIPAPSFLIVNAIKTDLPRLFSKLESASLSGKE